MPVFVNSIVITGEVAGRSLQPAASGAARPAATAAAAGPDRDRLAEEITAKVMRRVEQALDRLTER